MSRRPKPAVAPRTIAEILGGLHGHSGPTERRAAEALVRLGPGAIPELVAAAAHGRSAFARAVAVNALSAHGVRGRPAILRALRDPAMPVRLAALIALDRTWSRAAAEPVIRLLRDPSGGIRVNAATVLGRHHVRQARRALTRALRDEKEYVKRGARDALSELPRT